MKIVDYLKALPHEIQLMLIGLGHIAPELTQAAVIAETVSGNAELVPETEVAGTLAQSVGSDVASGQNIEAVQAIVKQIDP